MRMSDKHINMMYNESSAREAIEGSLPEIWRFAPSMIMEFHTAEVWKNCTDQQRRIFLEYIE